MKLDIMGLQFDNVTMDEAAARAEQILAGDRSCYAVVKPHSSHRSTQIGEFPLACRSPYRNLRQLLPHRNRSMASAVLVDADVAFLFFHFHLPFRLKD